MENYFEDFETFANSFKAKATGYMSDYIIEQKLDVMREDWEDGLEEQVIQDFLQWEDYLETLNGPEKSDLYSSFDPFSFPEIEMGVAA